MYVCVCVEYHIAKDTWSLDWKSLLFLETLNWSEVLIMSSYRQELLLIIPETIPLTLRYKDNRSKGDIADWYQNRAGLASKFHYGLAMEHWAI